MPFVIDDITVAAAEMGEVAAETSEIAGAVAGPSEIIGDEIGEGAFENEKAIDVGEASDLSVPESTEIIGDGVGEAFIDKSIYHDEQKKARTEKLETTIDNSQADEISINDNTDSFQNNLEQAEVDDNGKPYIKDGELLPSNTYEINGVKYETDDKGRIIHAETSVEINNEPRPSLNSRKVDGLEPGDDKGHIVAHILGGADTEGNLVAMDSKLNRGEYKSMELGAKRALEEGKVVIMTVDIEYEGDSKRPKSFTVTLEIDNEITVKKFLNNKNE